MSAVDFLQGKEVSVGDESFRVARSDPTLPHLLRISTSFPLIDTEQLVRMNDEGHEHYPQFFVELRCVHGVKNAWALRYELYIEIHAETEGACRKLWHALADKIKDIVHRALEARLSNGSLLGLFTAEGASIA